MRHRGLGLVFTLSALVAAPCSAQAATSTGTAVVNQKAGGADAYATEYQRAIQGLLANIQSNGAIVASPSQTAPNYYYDWVRDSSLTMKAVIAMAYDNNTRSTLKTDLLARIDQWIEWELHLQVIPKLTDLGEPRFYIWGAANNEPWGRPQNDGPATRAIDGITIANQWISEGRMSEVNQKLYKGEIPAQTLVKRDLEYVAHHWQDTSIDLWEEERGMHFYTLLMQKVALLKGADLANRLNDGGGANYYAGQAKAIDQYLAQYWDDAAGTYRYAANLSNHLPQKTTNLDMAIILAAIETFDGQFYMPADKLAKTAAALTAQFQAAYPVNGSAYMRAKNVPGVAMGRYPGDVYDGVGSSGGNPWFLSTLALGEFYCDVNKAQAQNVAKQQFDRVMNHMNAAGDLSEQFNKTTGFEQGAHDLTWSYTSYITAYRACFQ